MKDGASGKMIYRKDYTPYPWDVTRLDLFFVIGRETTTVRVPNRSTTVRFKSVTNAR